MNKTAYVIENDVIVNIIVVDEKTDLKLFNAVFIEDFQPLPIGSKRVNGKWYSSEGVEWPRFDPYELKGKVFIDARNEELKKSDWTQLPDSPLSPELKQAWAVYRQALRDIPQQANYPAEINMPLQPGQPLDDANNKS